MGLSSSEPIILPFISLNISTIASKMSLSSLNLSSVLWYEDNFLIEQKIVSKLSLYNLPFLGNKFYNFINDSILQLIWNPWSLPVLWKGKNFCEIISSNVWWNIF